MAVRHAMETTSTYAQAVSLLNRTRVLGPAYIIVGGVEAAEGVVLTKGAAHGGVLAAEGTTIDVWSLGSELSRSPPRPFLVETNYDHWEDPPPYDDRRDPAVDCLQSRLGGPAGYNFSGLYNVLSSVPNLNWLTAFTTLMHARSGELETYRQVCDDWKRCPPVAASAAGMRR